VADADAMVTVLGDPALYAFTGGEPPELDALRETYGHLVAGPSDDPAEAWHNWIVRLAATGTAVGTVQATLWEGERRAEVAWLTGTPWQGHGYASEAARAVVDWLASVGVRTIEAHIHPDHRASAAVAVRIGLRATEEVVDGEHVWRSVADAAPELDG
jgi:RimJ/RimL family protein N-acetyltransferase